MDYLKQYQTSKKPYTHYSIFNPGACYYIPNNKLQEFYKEYDKCIKKGNIFSIVEVPPDNASPIKIDMDLTCVDNIRTYTLDNIHKTIGYYIKLLKKNVTKLPNKFNIYVYEKEAPTNNRDGFHIMIDIPLNYDTQLELRKLFIEKYAKKIFPDEDASHAFDKCVIKSNGWLMNGSRSKPGAHPYFVTQVYDENLALKEIPVINSLKLSVRNNNETVKSLIKECETQSIPQKRKIIQNEKESDITIDLDIVQKLVDILSLERAEDYTQWCQVGWALGSISSNCFDIFINFSKKCPKKFSEQECMKIFSKSDGSLTIASLHYWAKLDSPEAYKSIQKSILTNTTNMNNTVDTAKFLHKLYGHNYCFVISHDKPVAGWYKFYNHRWNYQHDGYDIRDKLINEIQVHLKDIVMDFITKMNMSSNNEEQEYCKNRIAKLNTLIGKLGNTSYLDNVVKECTFIFRNSELLDRMDRDPFLLGFNNGIYDLKNGIFRIGTPHDYVQMNTNIDYNPQASTKEVLRLFKDIIPNKNVRDYLLLTLASSLDYVNREEKFYIWIGGGRNGKSIIVDLHQRVLGNYACALPVSLITQKRPEVGRPVPEIAKMYKKRFCIIKEPDTSNVILNTGVIKELTGNDTISVRKLYHNDNEFRVSSTLFLMTNTLPDVNNNEAAIWDRIRVVPFNTYFCDNPSKPNEKLIDKTIKEKLDEWREGYMLVLLKYYSVYKEAKYIDEPVEVLESTNQYRERNNIILEYINKNIKESKTKSDKLTISVIYSHYSIWHKEWQKRELPTKKEFSAFISQHFGSKYKNNELIGHEIS